MRVLSFSETGYVRRNNEDAYLVMPEHGLYAVADGMGGHLAGEIAARTALRQLESVAGELKELAEVDLEVWVRQALNKANRVVFESSTRQPETEGMGTTLTVFIQLGNRALVANVGDSRAYLWHGQQLTRVTDDHSLVGELLRFGQISPAEAEKHPRRHVLTRAIGAAEQIEADCFELALETGDVVFLCTDGFSNVVTEEEISREFGRTASWDERLAVLRQMVFERGAPDNFTVLCCICD